eukprot:jgi/Botrbrau1/16411/Bobra.0142s0011.1
MAKAKVVPSSTAKRPPTPFEEKLYQVCKLVPKGKVTTYGAIAKVLNTAPRAVGQALRRNPFAPIVPCHRVISASCELGGFKGTWGETPECASKKDILASEGVKFKGSRLETKSALLAADDLAALLGAPGR